ncbi:MAG TPA: alpha/beta hydrolase, partial [Spirochaetia bacterium]|nr:alpha/beta hydrolase [Spirochaetia bacterium]
RAIPYMQQLDTPRSSGRVPPEALARVDALVSEDLPARDPIVFAAEYNAVLIPYACAVPSDDAPEWAHFPTRVPNEWAGNASIACGSLIDTLGLWDWRTEFASIEHPVLVVYGTEDYNPSPQAARELADTLGDGELVILEGAGHFAHVADRDAFFTAVHAFLTPE